MAFPSRIGKYELEQYLGGGMADVFRAHDTVIGRTVAVKILKDSFCTDQDARTRFLLEGRVAGNLIHENVIRIYDFGQDDTGRPFMVMEFLKGEDLAKAIKSSHTGDFSNKLRIASEIAAALEYIHHQKIIHRDIKPENIHVTESGVTKLMDFGIARTDSMSITRTGMAIGTPAYMAPEQIRAEPATELVDIYAYGVLLYELFTGERAFTGETYERVFYAVLTEPLDATRLQANAVPEALRELILKCAAKDRTQRPQSFSAVRQQLAALKQAASVAQAGTTVAGPEEQEEKRRRRTRIRLTIAVGCAALAVAMGLYVAVGPRSGDLPRRISTPTGEMILVPAGSFLLGRDKQSVSLPAYYIDRTEVTNKAYAAFSRATGHVLPDAFPKDKSDLPVVNVSFADAMAFAQWAGKRLPSSPEWEKAARGTDGRTFPWGNNAGPGRANVGNEGSGPPGTLAKATGFEAGASPFQVLQMVGNAWELVDEDVQPEPEIVKRYMKVLTPPPDAGERWVRIRGGSYREKLDPGVMWDSVVVPARFKSDLVGFRCVKQPKN